ncbi:MAG: phage major capsid protein [Rickettsiales bacterium]|nr:MAG: phage major capsid protein [Rickettsiales bacterium]
MEENKIEEMSEDLKSFLARESNTGVKINKIEGDISKMQNYFLNDNINNNPEEKAAFNSFIREGVGSDFINKSFSGGAQEGGVLITPTLNNQIISAINAKSPMRQLASIESISTRALDIVIEDGAFISGWVAESAARPDTNTPNLTKKTINAHELYAQPKATQSIIDDSEINIENWLSERLVDSFVKLENEAFINGDGNNKPFGLLANAGIGRIDVEHEVSPASLLNLINGVGEGYLENASFLMNRSTLSSIQSLTDEAGRFIWQQSLSDPLKQTIFGVPVVISSNMPDIADNSLSIAIGDFRSAYKIVDRSGMNLMRDPYTDKPFVKFYAVKRVGGDVVNPSAVKFARFAAAA